MSKGMRKLTTERKAAGAVRPRPARVIRVLPITDRAGTTQYYMNDFPRPVPAWMQYLDGSSVGSVLATLALVLLALGGPLGCVAWVLWQLLFE